MERNGATTAKGARSVMSGMVGMAMRHGSMTTNPTRDVAPISVKKKMVKVLTPAETERLVKRLRRDKEAKRLDSSTSSSSYWALAFGLVKPAPYGCHRSTSRGRRWRSQPPSPISASKNDPRPRQDGA